MAAMLGMSVTCPTCEGHVHTPVITLHSREANEIDLRIDTAPLMDHLKEHRASYHQAMELPASDSLCESCGHRLDGHTPRPEATVTCPPRGEFCVSPARTCEGCPF